MEKLYLENGKIFSSVKVYRNALKEYVIKKGIEISYQNSDREKELLSFMRKIVVGGFMHHRLV